MIVQTGGQVAYVRRRVKHVRGVMVLAARFRPLSDQIVRESKITPRLKVRRIISDFWWKLVIFVLI
jgi:hypothetical protein